MKCAIIPLLYFLGFKERRQTQSNQASTQTQQNIDNRTLQIPATSSSRVIYVKAMHEDQVVGEEHHNEVILRVNDLC